MNPRRRAVVVLLIAVALAGAALLLVSRLHVDTSLAGLFDDNDRAGQALVRVMDHFSAVEELLVFAQTEDASLPDTAKLVAFAERLEAAVTADPAASALAEKVSFKPDAQMRLFVEKEVAPNAVFYLDDKSFAAAADRLSRDGIIRQIRRDESLMSTPGPGAAAMSKLILKDPLRLHEFLLDRLAGQMPVGTMEGNGAFLSKDGRGILIRVRGKRPVSDLEFSRAFTKSISELAERTNTAHLRIDISGAYAIAARSEQAIRGDMISGVISSVVLLQALFLFAYRRAFRSFLIAFVPVAMGILYGFGAYAVFSEALTPMTAVIGGVLAGMAIDYGIAYMAFYHARRAEGVSTPEAASLTRSRIGGAITAAWATSVVGFFVIGCSRVPALRDFAFMGGLGLTGAFACTMLVLPSVLRLVDRRGDDSASPQRLQVDGLLRGLINRPQSALLGGGAIFITATAVLIWPGAILPAESDLSVMHPWPNAPLDALATIARRMGASPGGLVIHLQGDDDAKLVELAHDVGARLRSAEVRRAGIVGSIGLATVLPDPRLTEKRIAEPGPALADRVTADFRAAIADSVFDPAAYAPYENFLRTLTTATRPPAIADLRRYPSIAELMLPSNKSTTQSPTAAESIILLFTSGANETRETRDAAIAAIRVALADLPGATLTGLSVLTHDAEIVVRRELPRLVLIALAIVAAYLALYFRNLPDCLMAMLPSIFSFACVLAFMRLSGQKLNMINLVAFPLLIGIDVDYGIFLVSAMRRRSIGGLSAAQLVDRLSPAASAVILCAATTLLGFGSLMFTSVPAARSLGWAVVVGVLSCASAAVLLVVPLGALLRPRRQELAHT